jgi:hypothetical protein
VVGDQEVLEKINLQADYVAKKGTESVAPRDGVCWSCKKQIYNLISKEKASSELVTGCPYCKRDFCD